MEDERKREEQRKQEEKHKREENKRSEHSQQNDGGSKNETRQQWFSNEAYHDKNILKNEYRKLVSQYHPDNNHSPDAIKIFLEIQKEREEILEQLEK